MSFGSAIFLFGFLPLTAALYRLLPWRWARRVLVTGASLFFYACGRLWDLPVLLLSALLHYAAGRLLLRTQSRRAVVAAVVVLDLGLLAACKYLDFFCAAAGLPVGPLNLPLPLGVSFFTFQGISYVVDGSRDRSQLSRTFFPVLQYLCFFPNLVSGPLARFQAVRPQLEAAARPDGETAALALRRFTVGLGKKLLLAGTLAPAVDAVFALDGASLDLRTAWLGAVAYALQLYFDFSGYSDMALGLGSLFGVTLPENFRYPYRARSITDFWRRWHISLSQWFRDYLYIPLGGSRRGKARTVVNKLAVFLATGLWHGANWTFVLWGAWHGLFAALETATPLDRMGKRRFGHVYALLVVLVGFTLFRADTVAAGLAMISNLFTGFAFIPASTLALAHCLTARVWTALILGALGALGFGSWLWRKVSARRGALVCSLGLTLVLLVLCVLALASGSFQPFIYQQF